MFRQEWDYTYPNMLPKDIKEKLEKGDSHVEDSEHPDMRPLPIHWDCVHAKVVDGKNAIAYAGHRDWGGYFRHMYYIPETQEHKLIVTCL